MPTVKAFVEIVLEAERLAQCDPSASPFLDSSPYVISSVHFDMSNPFVGTMIKRKSTSLRDGVPPLCLFAASRVLSACALMPCPIRKQNPTPRKTC